MQHLSDFITPSAVTSILVILAAVLGLISRRLQSSTENRGEPAHSQANTANVVGDNNRTVQNIRHERNTYVNVSGNNVSTPAARLDPWEVFVLVAVAAFVAFFAFVYVHRYLAAAVGVAALFVAFASRSRLISLTFGLLAVVSFAGCLFWSSVKFGDASLGDLVTLKESGFTAFVFFDLSGDQRFLFGTTLFVLLLALCFVLYVAVTLVNERAVAKDPRTVKEWPLAVFTGAIVAAIVLTWFGVLPEFVERFSNLTELDVPSSSSAASGEIARSGSFGIRSVKGSGVAFVQDSGAPADASTQLRQLFPGRCALLSELTVR